MNFIGFLRSQAEIYAADLKNKVKDIQSVAEIRIEHAKAMKEFYSNAYRPATRKYKGTRINSDDMNSVLLKAERDVSIAYDQIKSINEEVIDAFNSNQDYKTSLRNRIEYLSSIAEDIVIMSDESVEGTVTFKDSLTNHNFIDLEFGSGQPATVSTAEGVAFLSVSNEEFINNSISNIKITGNGMPGNYYNTKKVRMESFNEAFNLYTKYKSEENPHDNPVDIVDGTPSTWFEYQKLGAPLGDIRKYNIQWAGVDEISDNLSLKITMELKREAELNWMDITPYLPERSKSNIKIYSIRTSVDGSNYSPVYEDEPVIDQAIYMLSQNYNKDGIFAQDSSDKLISQGVLNFSKRKAKFIEIVFSQTSPYDESLGQIVYRKLVNMGDKTRDLGFVDERTVPSYIVNGPVGKYKVTNTEYIIKEMVSVDGWRYSIGLRSIDMYKRSFRKQSEIITKKFESQQPIKKVMLYANEAIPKEYDTYGLEERNSWIQYYISVNDIDWHQISPMHHNQVGSLSIPPKIYEINSTSSSEERSINKGYIKSDSDIKNVRLKIVFTGAQEGGSDTPILEEYAIKCVTEGGIE